MHVTLLLPEAEAVGRAIRGMESDSMFCFSAGQSLHLIAAGSDCEAVFALLARSILLCCRPVYIARRVAAINPAMSAALRRRIFERAMETAPQDSEAALADCLMRAFAEHDTIDLAGLLRFRMKDMLRGWNAAADAAFAAAADESVYEEYTQVLAYYLRYAVSKAPLVHIWVAGSRYHMTDGAGRDIELTAFDSPDWFYFDMTGADRLLSTLLDLAPEKIIIHGAEPVRKKGLIYSIGRIFDDRVVFV